MAIERRDIMNALVEAREKRGRALATILRIVAPENEVVGYSSDLRLALEWICAAGVDLAEEMILQMPKQDAEELALMKCTTAPSWVFVLQTYANWYRDGIEAVDAADIPILSTAAKGILTWLLTKTDAKMAAQARQIESDGTIEGDALFDAIADLIRQDDGLPQVGSR